MPLTRKEAARRNASVAIETNVGPAARPFMSAAYADSAAVRALDCLATAVYYEAASEPLDTQRAVAQVVLNRMRHASYPSSICGVVFEGSSRRTGCQFTFTCDGALQRRRPDSAGWRTATRIAAQALAGYVHAPVGLATHFHADWVVPYWSTSLAKVGKIGTTIFYRWRGSASHASAFKNRYSGVEPTIFPAPSEQEAQSLEPMPELAEIPVSYKDEAQAAAKVDDFGLLDYAVKSAPAPMEARNPLLAEAVVAASQAGAKSGSAER
ncbi:MAG: cell wall hydrolase [Sphingomicrobium sp.]